MVASAQKPGANFSAAQKEQPKKKGLVARTLSLPNFFGLQEGLTDGSLTGSPKESPPDPVPPQPTTQKKRKPSATLSPPVLFAAETLTSAAETLTSAAAALIPEPGPQAPEPETREPADGDSPRQKAVVTEKKRQVSRTLTLPAFFSSAAETLSAAAENLNTVAENLGAKPARPPRPKKIREHKTVYQGPAPGSLLRPAGSAEELQPAPPSFDLDPESQKNFVAKLFFLAIKQVVDYHNQRVTEEEGGSRSVWQSPGFLIVFAILFIFGATQIPALLHPQQNSASKIPVPKVLSGSRLESCDKQAWIELLPHQKCAIHKFGSTTDAKYSIVPENPDLLALFKGYLSRREIWYQYDADSVTDQEKTVMYRQDAPELAVVRKMKWYADFAQQQFRENGSYPSNAESMKRLDPHYGYTNPFTGKGDYANILLQIRPNNNLDFVEHVFSDRIAHPGEIYCVCINSKFFVIQGYDRNAKPLTSANPAQHYTLEYGSGRDITKREPIGLGNTGFKATTPGEKPLEVIFYGKEGLDSTIQWFRRFSLILLWTGVFAAGLFCYVSFKTEKAQNIKDMSIVSVIGTVVFLIAWYLIAL
jgi:hypothetical protein